MEILLAENPESHLHRVEAAGQPSDNQHALIGLYLLQNAI